MNIPFRSAGLYTRGVWVAMILLLPLAGETQRGSQGYVPQLYQGQQALKDGKWNAALYHFRMALEWDHNGVEAYIGLGNAYLKTGRPRRAVAEFQEALQRRPHSAEAERGIHEARSEGEEEAAFVALQQQVKAMPDNADAHAAYAEELLERNRVEEAQKEAETALRLDGKEGHAYCALGRIAARQNREEDARKNLEMAIKFDRTDDDAFAGLGDLAMRRHDYKQAVTFYRRVLRLVPESAEAHTKLIEALTAIGDTHGVEKEKEVLARLTQAK